MFPYKPYRKWLSALAYYFVRILRFPPPRSNDNRCNDALAAVQTQLQAVATAVGIELPEDYPATPTIRKDLETLRRYGVLDRRMYRWGYYLGTGAMNREELQVAFNTLTSMVKEQDDPQVNQLHQTLTKRLRGLDLELKN